MPTGSPKLKDMSAFTDRELHAFEHALPSGGTTCSTHYPKHALSWVETHFNDGLLACMRLRGLGGPMATMLSPETPALAVFGSIKRKWVLRAAKTLADISGFPVIIQPRLDDPTLQWNSPSGSHERSDVEAERDRGGEAGGMVPPTADEDRIDEYAGWMSPVHRSDIHLQLCTTANIARGVTIAAETQVLAPVIPTRRLSDSVHSSRFRTCIWIKIETVSRPDPRSSLARTCKSPQAISKFFQTDHIAALVLQARGSRFLAKNGTTVASKEI
ncbi:hypothetical protein C8R47DRAFT_816401 [Mycena vitilis]|nr:hypothetical protein C8R47DRAFT_816401 [Mycena vitilis]